MPTVTTSSATGSRVLQKAMSPDTLREQSTDAATPNRTSAAKGLPEASPGKRASTSSNMSSKIKRFPTLLSRKESRSKGEITNGSGLPRSAANGDGRRKSTSGPVTSTAKPSTPTHGRSTSLASATPSSLPRPVPSAGLPSSATSPNLAGLADSGRQEHSPSPTSFGGSPRRVPPPGQESSIPRLVTSPRSASGAQNQELSDTQDVVRDTGLNGNSSAPLEANDSEPTTRSPSTTDSPHGTGNDQALYAATENDPGAANSTSDTKLYTVHREGSPGLATSDATASSEHLSRTSSGTRIPIAMAKTSSKNVIPETGTSPDTTVPAMWRSNSYEGTAHAYITGSQPGNDTLPHPQSGVVENMASSDINPSQTPGELYTRQPAIGIEGLRELLESQPTLTNNPSIAHRIQLLRQLVHLRGEPVLSGVDVSQIVWAEGTDAHISAEEEFSRARNGKALSQPGSPVAKPPQTDQTLSTPSSNKKHGIFDRVTARFGGSHKSNQGDSIASVSLSEKSDAGSPRPSAQSVAGDNEGHADKRGPVFGTRLQEIPPLAMAISIIGGQRHQLPILVFSLVEAIFKRGLDTSGIFRMNGNAASVQRLVEFYNTWPSYGDDHSTDDETIFTLCEVLKKYLKDLPEPLLGGPLWTVFVYGCLADNGQPGESEHYLRMAAVQVIFRLLPRKNMSLLIYLIAFLYQVSLRPANRLTTESISVIFGSSLLGLSRTATGTGTGINSSKASSEGLRWLLENWEDSLSQDLLDEDYDCFASPFVGQAAWSTPNLLGEMQSNPFNADNGAAVVDDQVEITRQVDAHPTPTSPTTIYSAEPPNTATEPQEVDSAPPAAVGTGNEAISRAVDAVPLSNNRSISPGDSSQGAPVSQKAGSRSVSGFAKGENFSDDDIASDPNAAQLFGSLSQLFASERRKVKEYQQQVIELKAQATQYEVVIQNLRAALAQNNNHVGIMQNRITALQSKNDALAAEARQSSSTLQEQEHKISAMMRTAEETKQAHTSHSQELEQERKLLQQKHANELESLRVNHDKTLEEERQTLLQQHSLKEQEYSQLQEAHQAELRSLQATLVTETTRFTEEIHQLREAVQVSDRERDGARTHLQRIRTLLDSA